MDNNGMSMTDIINISSQSGAKTDSQLGLTGNSTNQVSNAGLKIVSEGTQILQHSLDTGTKSNLNE